MIIYSVFFHTPAYKSTTIHWCWEYYHRGDRITFDYCFNRERKFSHIYSYLLSYKYE